MSLPLTSLNITLIAYMVIGLIGNVLILLTFATKTHVSDNKRIMLWFAVFDLAVCCFNPILSIWRNVAPLSSVGNAICSTAWFETRTICTMPGLLILLAVVKNYLELNPKWPQMTMKDFKKYLTWMFIYSVVLHLPMLVIYGDVSLVHAGKLR